MKGRLCTWGSVTALMGAFCVAPCFAQTLTWLGTLDYGASIATEQRAYHLWGTLMEMKWLTAGVLLLGVVVVVVIALSAASSPSRRRQEASDGGSVAGDGGGDYNVREDAPAESQGGGSWWDAISDWFSSGDAGDAGGDGGGGDGGGGD